MYLHRKLAFSLKCFLRLRINVAGTSELFRFHKLRPLFPRVWKSSDAGNRVQNRGVESVSMPFQHEGRQNHTKPMIRISSSSSLRCLQYSREEKPQTDNDAIADTLTKRRFGCHGCECSIEICSGAQKSIRSASSLPKGQVRWMFQPRGAERGCRYIDQLRLPSFCSDQKDMSRS